MKKTHSNSDGRTRRIRSFRAAGMVAALLLGLTAGSPSASADELDCDYLPRLIKLFLQRHITFNHLNDELRERSIETYIKRLDPSKTLYLPEDIQPLKTKLRGVFHDVHSGNCTALIEVHADLVKRVEAMEGRVRKVLEDEDYEVDTSVTLILDPDKRSRPTTVKNRDAFVLKLLHFQMTNYLSNDLELPEAKEKLVHRYELISKRARDRDTVDILSGFVDSFANALDPHSNYLSAEAMEDFQIQMGLSLEGIGVALSSRDGYSVVEKIIPGGAADELDVLEPKDKIIAVSQEGGEFVDIIDMELRDVVRLIRGKRGTKVHLKILRQGDSTERFDLTIVRDKINLEEQAASLRFETLETPVPGNGEDEEPRKQELKLAVLELPSFYGGRSTEDRQSSRDLRNLLEEVKKEKADGLLLDLSRNGGGLLNGAIDIAGFFIDDGGVVAVKNTDDSVRVMEDPDHATVFEGPMVILTSRISASASEIVAGAMKDYGRAVLVGDDHTFGKGTVQTMHPLPEGLGALKVTTAVFFRPGGNSTQHAGVDSDVVIPSVLSVRDIGEMHHDYSMPGAEIQAFGGVPTAKKAVKSRALQWQSFDGEHVEALQKRSSDRVAASEEFAEIQEEADEVTEKDGVIYLADLLEDDEKETEEADEEAPAADEKTEANTDGDGEKDSSGTAENDGEASSEDGTPESTETAKSDSEEEGEEEDEDEPSPQQREALRILADHVVLLKSS